MRPGPNTRPGGRVWPLVSRFAGDSTGAMAVEFAFGAIIFFGLVMGIMDLSRAMHILDTIEHAAREGARYAAIHGDDSENPKTDMEITNFAMNMAPTVDQDKLTTTVAWDPDRTAGSRVTITVTYNFSHLFAEFFPASAFDLTAESTYTVTR